MKMIANGFFANLPAEWNDRTLTTWAGPTGKGGFAPNVVVVSQSILVGTRVESFARDQLQATRAELPGLEVLTERFTALGGLEAFERLQRFSAGSRLIKQSQLFVIKGVKAWVLTCSAQLEEFEANARSFEMIVKSFRFFDPEIVP
jgi:hypothetical protein